MRSFPLSLCLAGIFRCQGTQYTRYVHFLTLTHLIKLISNPLQISDFGPILFYHILFHLDSLYETIVNLNESYVKYFFL